MKSFAGMNIIFSCILLSTPILSIDLEGFGTLKLNGTLNHDDYPTMKSPDKKDYLFIALKTVNGFLIFVNLEGDVIKRILEEKDFPDLKTCRAISKSLQKDLKNKYPDLKKNTDNNSDIYNKDAYFISFKCDKRKKNYYLMIEHWI